MDIASLVASNTGILFRSFDLFSILTFVAVKENFRTALYEKVVGFVT